MGRNCLRLLPLLLLLLLSLTLCRESQFIMMMNCNHSRAAAAAKQQFSSRSFARSLARSPIPVSAARAQAALELQSKHNHYRAQENQHLLLAQSEPTAHFLPFIFFLSPHCARSLSQFLKARHSQRPCASRAQFELAARKDIVPLGLDFGPARPSFSALLRGKVSRIRCSKNSLLDFGQQQQALFVAQKSPANSLLSLSRSLLAPNALSARALAYRDYPSLQLLHANAIY